MNTHFLSPVSTEIDTNLYTLSHQQTNILWNLYKTTHLNACASILDGGIGSKVIKSYVNVVTMLMV